MTDSVTTLEYKGRVAILTIDNEEKLNALSQHQYYDIAQKLREVATHDEVYITVLLAKGRFFSAYAAGRTIPPGTTPLLPTPILLLLLLLSRSLHFPARSHPLLLLLQRYQSPSVNT